MTVLSCGREEKKALKEETEAERESHCCTQRDVSAIKECKEAIKRKVK